MLLQFAAHMALQGVLVYALHADKEVDKFESNGAGLMQLDVQATIQLQLY